MKPLLDNLFFLGEVVSLAGLAWGAGMVLRESLIGIVCRERKHFGLVAALAGCIAHPFRRVIRI